MSKRRRASSGGPAKRTRARLDAAALMDVDAPSLLPVAPARRLPPPPASALAPMPSLPPQRAVSSPYSTVFLQSLPAQMGPPIPMLAAPPLKPRKARKPRPLPPYLYAVEGQRARRYYGGSRAVKRMPGESVMAHASRILRYRREKARRKYFQTLDHSRAQARARYLRRRLAAGYEVRARGPSDLGYKTRYYEPR